MKRKRKSYPRLEALGWDRKEPTEIIMLGLERVKQTVADGDAAFRNSVASVVKITRELGAEIEDDIDEVVEGDQRAHG